MSGIALLEKATGPLAEIYARLGKAWTPEMQAMQARVGKFFQGLAEDPAYSATSRDIPKGTDRSIAWDLAKKHGLDPHSLITDQGSLTVRPSGASISPIGDTPLTLTAALRTANEDRRATLNNRIQFSKDAGMAPYGDFHAIDMMGALAGTGMAKKFYPLFTDWLLAHPGTAALELGLSEPNMQKKGLYQAMAMEKYGDRGRNLMQIAPEQLDGNYGAFGNDRQFQRSGTPTQIGALNMAIGNNTTAKIRELLSASGNRFASKDLSGLGEFSSPDDLAKFDYSLQNAKRLGLSENFTPSSNMDFNRIGDSIGDLSSQLGIARPVGYDTLRRSGLTNDFLTNPDMDPRDFLGSETIRGLAKAKGGHVQVPGTHPGPLSQCGCGAK